jgi:putative ABC transport system permease protein
MSTKKSAMFLVTYLRRELQRRKRQTVLIAVGLAVGVGLVMTVTAAATGVSNAQTAVLHSLYGIGTDITVTTARESSSNDTQGSGHVFTPGNKSEQKDFLALPPGLGLLDASSVASISKLHGVVDAAGGLSLVETKLTVPSKAEAEAERSQNVLRPITFTVNGVDLAHLKLGPFASGKISSGRGFSASDADANVAIVDSHDASANKLSVGSTITIANARFTIVGITDQPQGGGSADVYIPLARAQALTSNGNSKPLAGKVDTIYVAAAGGADISAVHAKIAKLLPSATVTSSGDLAKKVSGSLATASNLATDLGRWLAIVVLIAAFVVASLLTMAAVARRVREFGTLKALGWRTRRIIAQIMAESLVVGVIGAVLGIALGFGGAVLIDAIAPKLSATIAQNPGSTPAQGALINSSGIHHLTLPGGVHTVTVDVSAPVSITTIVLAVVLAMAGALIAGSLGGWRAARLRPAQALVRVA